MLRDLYEDSLWGLAQLLAAYVLTDEDREQHPELVERGFIRSWADSMVRSVVKEGFKKDVIRVILDNPVQTHTHAGFCLSVRNLNGQSPYRVGCAAEDLRVQLWHYGNGDGPDLFEGDDVEAFGADLLVQVGHDREVATIAAQFMVADISSALLRRLSKRQASRESWSYGNAKFRRGEAVLGVRPWVYDGAVDPSQDEEGKDTIRLLLNSINYREGDGLMGRWTTFTQDAQVSTTLCQDEG